MTHSLPGLSLLEVGCGKGVLREGVVCSVIKSRLSVFPGS